MILPKHVEEPNPDYYLERRPLILDMETTNEEKGSALNSFNTLLLTVVQGHMYHKGSYSYHGNEVTSLIEHIEETADYIFLVGHNIKFELQWLSRYGLDLTKVLVFDTQIAEYVLLGNRKEDLSLNGIARRYGLGTKSNTVSRLISCGVCPSTIPENWLLSYCVQDVELTRNLYEKQLELLKEKGLLGVMYTRCFLTPALSDIEGNGHWPDAERVNTLHALNTRRMNELEREIHGIAGINPSSPRQVAKYLFEELRFPVPKDWKGDPLLTPSGEWSASDEVVNRLVAKNKRQVKFLDLYKEYTEKKSRVTKYLNKLKEAVDNREAIIANFNQTVTDTHRLSSTGKRYKIQLHNIDRNLKPVFTARYKGWKIVEGDEAQLEFRTAVGLADDEQGIRDIKNKEDIHSFTAKVLTEAGQETDRQGAKEHTFKPLYGGTSGTKAEQEYYRAFRQKYPQIHQMQSTWVDRVLSTGYLKTPWGLIFYWPDTTVKKSGYVTNTSKIYNYPIQSFATADIVPIAVAYLWHKLKSEKLRSFIINTIHDSAILESPEEETERVGEIVKGAFTEDVYKYLSKVYNIEWSVPLEAEIKVGDYWSEPPNWAAKYMEAT